MLFPNRQQPRRRTPIFGPDPIQGLPETPTPMQVQGVPSATDAMYARMENRLRRDRMTEPASRRPLMAMLTGGASLAGAVATAFGAEGAGNFFAGAASAGAANLGEMERQEQISAERFQTAMRNLDFEREATRARAEVEAQQARAQFQERLTMLGIEDRMERKRMQDQFDRELALKRFEVENPDPAAQARADLLREQLDTEVARQGELQSRAGYNNARTRLTNRTDPNRTASRMAQSSYRDLTNAQLDIRRTVLMEEAARGRYTDDLGEGRPLDAEFYDDLAAVEREFQRRLPARQGEPGGDATPPRFTSSDAVLDALGSGQIDRATANRLLGQFAGELN